MRILRVLPLAIRMVVLMLLGIALATGSVAWLSHWLSPWAAALVAMLAVGGIMALLVWRTFVPLRALFRALAGTDTPLRLCSGRPPGLGRKLVEAGYYVELTADD